MSKKAIGWVLLIFCILVLYNYISVSLGDFFSSGGFARFGSFGEPSSVQNYKGLQSIDLNFFDTSGVGHNYVTQGYGRTASSYLYMNDWHNGIDIAASFGMPIYSPAGGTVLAVVNQDAYCPHIAFGKYVAIDDTTNHLILFFAHLGTFAVSDGDHISKGTLIGTIGSTGLETGSNLHFSIFEEQGFVDSPAHGCGPYPQGQDVNPLNYLGTLYK